MRRFRLLLLAALVTLPVISYASVSALPRKVVRLSSASLVSNRAYIRGGREREQPGQRTYRLRQRSDGVELYRPIGTGEPFLSLVM